jgi:hypothetical protein
VAVHRALKSLQRNLGNKVRQMDDTERLIDRLASAAGPVNPSPCATLLWLALACGHGDIDWRSARIPISRVLPSRARRSSGSPACKRLAAYSVFRSACPAVRRPGQLPRDGDAVTGEHRFGCMRFRLADAAHSRSKWKAGVRRSHHHDEPAARPVMLVMFNMPAWYAWLTALLMALSAAACRLPASADPRRQNALMVLFWHAGAVLVLSSLSWLMGRQLFSWIGYARR